MMIRWLNSRNEFNLFTEGVVEQYRQLIEPFLLKESKVKGYCRFCDSLRDFKVSPNVAEGEWVNLLEGMECVCGLNGRMRLILAVLDELLTFHVFKESIVLERLTPLYAHLSKRMPQIVGTEFLGESYLPGEMINTNNGMIRNESLMQLSFANSSIDLIMHFDVIEHVPDMTLAFQEVFRCLKPGGVMFFTCPFYHNLEKNIIRASIVDGELVHHLEPSFHGNPISGDGSLVFQHPSWEIIDMMEAIGFKNIKLPLAYLPLEGIVSNSCPYEDGHMWPIDLWHINH